MALDQRHERGDPVEDRALLGRRDDRHQPGAVALAADDLDQLADRAGQPPRIAAGSVSIASVSAVDLVEHVLAQPRHGGELHAVGHLVQADPEPEVASGRPSAGARRRRGSARPAAAGRPDGRRTRTGPSTLPDRKPSTTPTCTPVTRPPMLSADPADRVVGGELVDERGHDVRMPPVFASIQAGRSTTRVDGGDRRLVELGQLGDVAGGRARSPGRARRPRRRPRRGSTAGGGGLNRFAARAATSQSMSELIAPDSTRASRRQRQPQRRERGGHAVQRGLGGGVSAGRRSAIEGEHQQPPAASCTMPASDDDAGQRAGLGPHHARRRALGAREYRSASVPPSRRPAVRSTHARCSARLRPAPAISRSTAAARPG